MPPLPLRQPASPRRSPPLPRRPWSIGLGLEFCPIRRAASGMALQSRRPKMQVCLLQRCSSCTINDRESRLCSPEAQAEGAGAHPARVYFLRIVPHCFLGEQGGKMMVFAPYMQHLFGTTVLLSSYVGAMPRLGMPLFAPKSMESWKAGYALSAPALATAHALPLSSFSLHPSTHRLPHVPFEPHLNYSRTAEGPELFRMCLQYSRGAPPLSPDKPLPDVQRLTFDFPAFQRLFRMVYFSLLS